MSGTQALKIWCMKALCRSHEDDKGGQAQAGSYPAEQLK